MGNERLKSAAGSVSAATAPLADIGARNLRSAAPKFTNSPPTAPDMDDGSSQHLGETLRDANSAASDAVSDTAAAIKDRFKEGVDLCAAKTLGKLGDALPRKETIAQVQSSFSRSARETTASARRNRRWRVGAAVAGAFRASELESEMDGRAQRQGQRGSECARRSGIAERAGSFRHA